MSHVLLTGASGFLGHHIARRLLADEHDVVGTFGAHAEHLPQHPRCQPVAVDLTDEASIEKAFRVAWPEVVIHTAAITEIKACEVDPARAEAVNVAATRKLARLCAAFGARFMLLSTDQVFDGEEGGYREHSVARPIHGYGRSKLQAEEAARRNHPSPTILRICLAYGTSPTTDRSASEKVVNALRTGQRAGLFTDEIRSPVLAEDVASACVELMLERTLPLLHLGGPERVSRHDFGLAVARAYGLDETLVQPVSLAEANLLPPRPRDVSFDTRRIRSLLTRPPRSIADGLATLAASGLASGPGDAG